MESRRGLYKPAASKAGISGTVKREKVMREQKRKREATFLERRKIEPQPSPTPVRGKKVEAPAVSRLERLLKWKAEKDKILAQQKLSKKPPFKLGVISHHPLDPAKELPPLPPRTTTVKCTTAKKSAAVVRADAADKRKARPATSATVSLASLKAPHSSSNASEDSAGPVTRSRTAAAALRTATSQREIAVSRQKAKAEKSVAGSSSSTHSKARGGIGGTKPTTQKVNPVVTDQKKSFAPKDHKFKAPATLTFPTTPITLKRKTTAVKDHGWPVIPGVSLLAKSPGSTSPAKQQKPSKPSALERKGRLSRAVTSRTPKRSEKVLNAASGDSGSPSRGPSSSSGLQTRSGDFDVTDLCVSPSKKGRKGRASNTPARSSRKVEVESAEEIMESSDSESIINVNETLLETSSALILTKSEKPRKYSASKTRGSSKEKENVPSTKCETVTSEDQVHSEADPFEALIINSGRMSIHEPSAFQLTPSHSVEGMVPAQFSPYVTSARGKDKYSLQKRRSSLIPMALNGVPPEELSKIRQIEHFRNLVERESSRLLTLCELWEERKAEAPIDVQDNILAPIGQGRLLVKDKFQQFKKLVDKLESDESEVKITAEDLTGFWEMILLTVKNVDKRFKELEDLRSNDWKEKVQEFPVKKMASTNVVVSKPNKVDANSSSRVRAMIEAARKRKQELQKQTVSSGSTSGNQERSNQGLGGNDVKEKTEEVVEEKAASVTASISKPVKGLNQAQSRLKYFIEEARKQRLQLREQASSSTNAPDATTFDGGFFKVESPRKSQQSPKLTPKSPAKPATPFQLSRRSLLQQVLTNSAVRAQRSPAVSPLNKSLPLSPSPKVVAIQMLASNLGRRISLGNDSCSPGASVAPSKSILKSKVTKSSKSETPRNRVAFKVLHGSANSSCGSPCLNASEGASPTNRSSISGQVATPGSRKRVSLIPRPISTPRNGERPSLMPMRASLTSSEPLPGGDLIDWSSPKLDSRLLRRSRRSNI